MNRELHTLLWNTRAEFVLMRRKNHLVHKKDNSNVENDDHEDSIRVEFDEIICDVIQILDDILASEGFLFNTILLTHIIQSLTLHLYNLKTCQDTAVRLLYTILPVHTTHIRVQCHIQILINICNSNLVTLCSTEPRVKGCMCRRSSYPIALSYKSNVTVAATVAQDPSFSRPFNRRTSINLKSSGTEKDRLGNIPTPTSPQTIRLSRVQSSPASTNCKPKFDAVSSIIDNNTTTPEGNGYNNTTDNNHNTTRPRTSTPSMLVRHGSINSLGVVSKQGNIKSASDPVESFVSETIVQHDRLRLNLFSKSLLNAHSVTTHAMRNSIKDDGSGLPIRHVYTEIISKIPQFKDRWPTISKVLQIGRY